MFIPPTKNTIFFDKKCQDIVGRGLAPPKKGFILYRRRGQAPPYSSVENSLVLC